MNKDVTECVGGRLVEPRRFEGKDNTFAPYHIDDNTVCSCANDIPAVAEKAKYTTNDLCDLLRIRFCPPVYALLFEVRDAAGFSAQRTADALAMGLWPSRGLHLIGFEIKASRADWLRELKNPAKAERFHRYCDMWYIVAADRTIVRDDELPPGWGLLTPMKGTGRGGLHTHVAASAMAAEAPSRSFLAALLKRSIEQSVDAKALQDALEQGKKLGLEGGKLSRRMLEGELNQLRERVQKFEQASGVSLLNSWESGGEIGRAVKMVLNRRHESEEGRLRRILDEAKKLVEQIENTLATAER